MEGDAPSSVDAALTSGLDESRGSETIGLLEQKLQAAEQETQRLVGQLANIGFSPSRHDPGSRGDPDPRRQDPGNRRDPDPAITPYKARLADPEVLQQNYEALVSRVCRAESALQTVRLTMSRVEAERDESGKAKREATQKLAASNATYEKEVSRLRREAGEGRREAQRGEEERQRLREEVQRLQEEINVAASSKSEVALEADDLKVTRQRLSRRVGELQQELGRETSLRSSLEDSHSALLTRVKEMEAVVQREREEIKSLNASCGTLKRDCMRAQDLANSESEMRRRLEDQLVTCKKESDSAVSQVKTLEIDKQFLLSELGQMKVKYGDLHGQIDQMTKLVSEKQTALQELEAENKNLYEAMRAAAEHNAQLIAQYEQQIQLDKAKLANRLQATEQIKSLRNQLTAESREKGQLQSVCSQQEKDLADLRQRLKERDAESTAVTSQLQETVLGLKERVKGLELERERAERDKENLISKVSSTADGLAEEKAQLQAEVERSRIELQGQQQAHRQLTAENANLLERVAAFDERRTSQQHVDRTMAEMVEQKNKLAYEKGRLQSQLEQLRADVESLAHAQTDLVQARRLNTDLEAKFHKSQTELQAAQMALQRLESELKHSHVTSDRKERDFSLALQSRDEALRDAEKLRAQVDAAEERQRQHNFGSKRNLDEAREDNKKISATLERVMASHAQLQATVEGLQEELGRRDSQLQALQEERADQQYRARQLQKEVENLQTRTASLQAVESSEVKPLRVALQRCKDDNMKLATTLEALVASNAELQATVQELQGRAEKEALLLQQTQQARQKDYETHKEETRTFEERLENLKKQLSAERSKNLKKTNKEVAEVRKQLEELLGRNGELSRANTDLRHRLTEAEHRSRELRERVATQKNRLEHLGKAKKKHEQDMDGLKNIGDQIDNLERSNKQYIAKIQQQSREISGFEAQVSSLQADLQTLARAQQETTQLLQLQEEELQRERGYSEQLRTKLKENKKREQQLERLREETERKLTEANNESMQISYSLQDAHQWFKSKFDSLQGELVKSRRTQASLEQENEQRRRELDEERRRAHETTERAQHMIKTSRETISRIADYAEATQHENRKHVTQLTEELLNEKQYGLMAERKLRQVRATGLRHTEHLAQELELLKSQVRTASATHPEDLELGKATSFDS